MQHYFKVASIVSNIEKGSVGIQECVKAISTLDGLISDIDTTRIVAESHTLTKNDDSAFNQHKEVVFFSANIFYFQKVFSVNIKSLNP